MGIGRPKQKTVTIEQPTRTEPFPLSHVAIIMDGNRRWADKLRLPRLLGHREGVKTLKELVKYAGAHGLKYLTVYAFSSENWNRSDKEVKYLLELLCQAIGSELDELDSNGVRLRFIGDLSGMPDNLRQEFEKAMLRTSSNKGLSLQVAVNYGSRLEITHAMRRVARAVKDGQLSLDEIEPAVVSSYLYSADIPDPDLLIRTAGEMRLSNFLLWQAAYSELYITPVLWPEFTPCQFELAVAEFSLRQRRFGGD